MLKICISFSLIILLIHSIRKKELKKNEFPKSWTHFDDDIIDGRPVNPRVSYIDESLYFYRFEKQLKMISLFQK